MYLLYLLDGTVAAWMKSSVFIHLMQLPSNPIIFGFGRLALRCDFSKTKIQPLTLFLATEVGVLRGILLFLGVVAQYVLDRELLPVAEEPLNVFHAWRL